MRIFFPFVAALVGAWFLFGSQVWARELRLLAKETLRFEPLQLSAEPGETVTIQLNNRDGTDMPHNLVLGRPGSLSQLIEAANEVTPESMARGYVPEGDYVLGAVGVLQTGERGKVTIELPEEKGVYPFACTFPGHATLMYGALYVGIEVPDWKKDKNLPAVTVKARIDAEKGREITRRPSVFRTFVKGSGPATICVALPEVSGQRQNFALDAGACQLRLAWSGGFVDPSKHQEKKGAELTQVVGEIYCQKEPDVSDQGTRPTFKGYAIDEAGVPTFEFEVEGKAFTEKIVPSKDGQGLVVHRTGPDGKVWEEQIEPKG